MLYRWFVVKVQKKLYWDFHQREGEGVSFKANYLQCCPNKTLYESVGKNSKLMSFVEQKDQNKNETKVEKHLKWIRGFWQGVNTNITFKQLSAVGKRELYHRYTSHRVISHTWWCKHTVILRNGFIWQFVYKKRFDLSPFCLKVSQKKCIFVFKRV